MLWGVLFVRAAFADHIRIATYNVELSRRGPGLLLAAMAKGDRAAEAAAAVVARVAPDVLVLNGIDFDCDLMTISAFAELVAKHGHEMPYRLALRPNSGWASGIDLDGDGWLGGPGDAQGFARYAGDGGMAVLSRYPFGTVRDLSGLIWARQSWASLPVKSGAPYPSKAAMEVQRLSSVGHWIVPVMIGERRLDVMAFHATTPVFDGPEDRNGKRNHDEVLLWQHVLNGEYGRAPLTPFVIAGDANLDPVDGAGIRTAIRRLLDDKRLLDPRPKSAGGRAAADAGQKGDPAFDTVDWPGAEEAGPGNLRVDYVLPSAELRVLDAGVYWPAPGADGHDEAQVASRHRLVWVDVGW
nr:endonuclease/exonuclease/phosphatase family protein [Aquicoccus sp. G2-2]MEA1114023.1 endonuclease/exonuclease/phosphatase family protein [Aquicoccus sp. G2-2]